MTKSRIAGGAPNSGNAQQDDERLAPAQREIAPARPVGRYSSCDLPNRPLGLNTSTITMNRYIRPSVNRGKPMLPNERIMPIRSAADQRADDRAHAADHGDDEGFDQDRESHAGRQRTHRRGERAGKPRQHAAEREHAAIDKAGVDAERRHHGPD